MKVGALCEKSIQALVLGSLGSRLTLVHPDPATSPASCRLGSWKSPERPASSGRTRLARAPALGKEAETILVPGGRRVPRVPKVFMCDSRDLTLQAILSNGVATVRQTLRRTFNAMAAERAKKRRKLVLTPDYINYPVNSRQRRKRQCDPHYQTS